MKINGMQKNSFVDYPGKISAVLFTPGCNMDCFYCHNRILLDGSYENLISSKDVLTFLESRKGFLDGVVVSGGEPTLQKGLLPFLRLIKSLGYPIKLDTNGTNPDVIKECLDEGLLDYIAMDFKAPLNKYKDICGTEVDLDNIMRSVDLIINSGISYEFRTTLAQGLDLDDIVEIAKQIRGAKLYVLQRCRNEAEEGLGYSADSIDYLLGRIKNIVNAVETRGMSFCA